ncbi:UNVERIFIED_CONTAM: hypothetical protein PYX00_009407 [Menopon gallinae]|uniref:Cytochrome b-c1 complex subunit 6 n=1 Tax=Menopon gallinae TaxID=328185 RepID=A0AAW2HBQ3_9NEOP
MENIFKAIFSSFKIPVVKADEELVDPQTVLKEQCGQEHCAAFQEKYDACNQRVNSKKNTSETCAEELFDFLECVDHCVAKSLFSKLK